MYQHPSSDLCTVVLLYLCPKLVGDITELPAHWWKLIPLPQEKLVVSSSK
jgi:hypothetical protein